MLKLAFGLDFVDLYRRNGLIKVDRFFLDHVRTADAALAERLATARANPDGLDVKAESVLIIDLAPHLERFISSLFGIADDVLKLVGSSGGVRWTVWIPWCWRASSSRPT